MLFIVSTLPFLLGLFILVISIKNIKAKKPTKLSSILIRKLLGETGTRIFAGIVGIAMMIFGFNFFMEINQFKFPGHDKKKTNIVVMTRQKIINASTTASSSRRMTLPELQKEYKYAGNSLIAEFTSISFKNNYIKKLPDFAWSMKELEEIDLTNNEFTSLPKEQLASLPKLKTLILTGNPIDSTEAVLLEKSLQVEIMMTED
ncbi:leucine-rich repeat domain-containing protein [Marinoscillum pacificum]|uniref:leucine-rich repeat domain-containing protein n=1 Tax=Marinoscillum pacificum TaxID=392723 RepID=UPI00215877A1|nr:leucine-rich repeat domain-containing protein [Marinoscillum pacificum]